MTIVNAEPKHAARISALVRELAEEEGESSPVTEAFVLSYLKDTDVCILLAEEGGEALGMISLSFRQNLFHAGLSCTIEELVVGKSARGKGIGGSLLDIALETADKRDCAEVSVSTEKDNAAAIALYKGRGMTDEFLYLEKHLSARR
jgi:ribosomal protein S18 acetylase RimI-like enzyme